jgi:UDPglucose 6-dehydrogenase
MSSREYREDMGKPVVSVVGLGKLGFPMLVWFASRGFRVIGVDVAPKTLEAIRTGRAPVFEPHLDELLNAHRQHITVTDDYAAAVRESDITFIVVPTPSERDGSFSLQFVLQALHKIGEALRNKAGFHLVAVTSTVLPGDMDEVVQPALEASSGKRIAKDFGLCYSPEFIALGTVIYDLSHPDFMLIGESDTRSGGILQSAYRELVDPTVPIVRMNLVNAELAKIAVNTFVTTKISYANMLAEICEQLPGADVDVVTSAVGLDSRIGAKYLRGRLGYGGPCFPRDNGAFMAMARRRGVQATLPEATDAVNRRQVARLAKRVRTVLPENGVVGVLGLAYKPLTDVVEDSQGLLLAQTLVRGGTRVIVYDPVAIANSKMVLGDSVTYASSMAECIENANVLVVATAWEEFRQLQPAALKHNPRRVVIDCWRILPRDQILPVADYLTIGTTQSG